MLKTDDPMLVADKKCPNVDKEVKEIMNSKDVKQFLENYAKNNMSSINKLFNETIKTLGRGQQLWDTLNIELDRNYIWNNLSFETQKEYVLILEEFSRLAIVYEWNRDLIKNVRVGSLVETLLINMQIIVNKTKTNNNYKLFLYSTHDSIVGPLLTSV
jgi:predicted N-acyltransferase